MEVVFQTTKKNPRPIYNGAQYVAVMADNTIIVTTADNTREEAPGVRARFLTKSGAVKFIDENPIKKAPIPVLVKEPVKSPAELEQERLAKLNPLEQLDIVKTEADFKVWLDRNKYKVSYTTTNLNINGLISYSWNIGNMPYCCGGKEHGSHDGSIHVNSSRYVTKERLEILSKYLAPYFMQALVTRAKGFGIISYIVSPTSLDVPSARIGMLFEASEYFDLAGSFVNPNTGNSIDIYTVNEKWPTVDMDEEDDDEEDEEED